MPLDPGLRVAVHRLARTLHLLPAALAVLALTSELSRPGPESDSARPPAGWLDTARVLWDRGEDGSGSATAAGWLVALAGVLLLALVVLCGVVVAGACAADVAEARRLCLSVTVVSAVLAGSVALVATAGGQLDEDDTVVTATLVLTLVAALSAVATSQVWRRVRADA